MKIKQGDLFALALGHDKKAILQFIGRDCSQMDSDVVAIFVFEDQGDFDPIKGFLSLEPHLFVHSMLKVGIQQNLFEKIGNSPVDAKHMNPGFKCFNEKGSTGRLLPFLDRDEWEVWRISDDVKFVKKLTAEEEEFNSGKIYPPSLISGLLLSVV